MAKSKKVSGKEQEPAAEAQYTVCPTCGQQRVTQKIHCPKHDKVYNPGEGCNLCDLEIFEDWDADESVDRG